MLSWGLKMPNFFEIMFYRCKKYYLFPLVALSFFLFFLGDFNFTKNSPNINQEPEVSSDFGKDTKNYLDDKTEHLFWFIQVQLSFYIFGSNR